MGEDFVLLEGICRTPHKMSSTQVNGVMCSFTAHMHAKLQEAILFHSILLSLL
jgi:hypothetical protein